MEFSLSHISSCVNGEIVGDKNLMISGVSEIDESRSGTISFLANPLYKKHLKSCKAAALFVKDINDLDDKNGIVVRNPQLAIAITLRLFHPKINKIKYENSFNHIDKSAKIGNNVIIGPGVVIGSGVIIGDKSEIGANTVIQNNTRIGSNCILYPNVMLYDNLILGKNIIIHSGSVIGSDGFGFVKEKQNIIKIPQVGNVIIEDNVEIGSNCSIDRGTIGSTIIGTMTKIDNLVHIAHNVKIGKSCFITAQVGIAGSTKIGDNCSFGGQSGAVSHIKIGDNSLISAKSGVTKSLIGNKTYGGFPIKEIKEFHKREALIGKIESIKKKISNLNN